MGPVSRRRFLRTGGAATAGALAAPALAFGQTPARVVVVGGGFAGATCAKYLKRAAPEVDVTLVDPAARYITCPFSNTVFGGFGSLDDLTFDRSMLGERYGIELVSQRAWRVDPTTREVTLQGGDVLAADVLVVAPGIGFDTTGIEGYSNETAEIMPHAWKAGEQTHLLHEQLLAMDDGGKVIIAVPPAPYRCPPAPYERASLIAHSLSATKPRSKVIIVDGSQSMPKGALFREGWENLYPGMIEHVQLAPDNQVERVDADTMTIETVFDNFSGEVVNLIPPQIAHPLAREADLTDSQGWCPVDPATFQSSRHPGVHVIGDAARSGLPKSASAGTSGAKVCAHAIAASLTGRDFGPPSFINACYSLLADDYAIGVAAVYEVGDDGLHTVPDASGTSPLNASQRYRRQEADDARHWFRSITADAFT